MGNGHEGVHRGVDCAGLVAQEVRFIAQIVGQGHDVALADGKSLLLTVAAHAMALHLLDQPAPHQAGNELAFDARKRARQPRVMVD